MTERSFVHDESIFNPAESPAGVELSDTEAKYAELFGEVIWDGIITSDERERLGTAAKIFGLSAERATGIEQALTAAYEARHQIQIVDDSHEQTTPASRGQHSIAPLAAAVDPRLQALQRRIAVVEKRNEELRRHNTELREAKARLEDALHRLQKTVEGQEHEIAAARAVPAAAAADGSDPGDAATAGPPPAVRAPQPAPSPPAAVPIRENLGEPRHRGAMDDGRLLSGSIGEADGPLMPFAENLPSRGDPSELHRLVRSQPRDAELLRALYATLQRGEDTDRRWCIAHVLDYLGMANDEERELHARFASSAVVQPVRAVNKDEWVELLMHPDEDRLTGEILSEVAAAVLLGQLSALRREHVSGQSYPSDEVDSASSPIEAVRCLVWASAFLGLKTPPVSVSSADPGLVELVLSPKPSSRLGTLALSSERTSKQLAFMAGRHLSWYRAEHILGKLAGSTRHLEDVFLAALMLGNPGLPMTDDIKQRVEPIARTIAPLVDADSVSKLRGFFSRFVEQGGRTNLTKWRRCVDRTAASTGLLLANDLASAEAVLRLEDESLLEERMNELIVFFTAGRCTMLRKRIGIAIAAT